MQNSNTTTTQRKPKCPPPNQVLQLIERSVRERFVRERFVRNLSEYKRPDYKEAHVRAEFIDPLLKVLGWDVRNVHMRGA